MKYISFWEFCPEDAEKVTEKWKRRKHRLKTLFPPHSIGGETKGFTIFESDDEDEIIKYILHYIPEMKIKVIPIFDSSNAVRLMEK